MPGWNSFVGVLSVVLSLPTTAYGGNLGLAIITLSLITRLALLPLTLRMARHAQAQQRILQTIKPEIDDVKAKYNSSPQKLGTELSKLYRKHGVKPIDGVNSLGLLAQLLLGAGVYSAIRRGMGAGGRFLWIRNLAQPNAILAVATGILTVAASLLGPHPTAVAGGRGCVARVGHVGARVEVSLGRSSLLGGINGGERVTACVVERKSA
jgi:YidC/Oxa1 family membrane protein insertase